MSYNGTLLAELNAAVERAESKVLADFDKLIAECDPVLYLHQVKSRLSLNDSSDIDARVIIGRIQDCHRTQLIDVCAHCGQLEGLHSFAGNNCPTDGWYSQTGTFERVEDRGERMIREKLHGWMQDRAGC
jgi:hypothetical protein